MPNPDAKKIDWSEREFYCDFCRTFIRADLVGYVLTSASDRICRQCAGNLIAHDMDLTGEAVLVLFEKTKTEWEVGPSISDLRFPATVKEGKHNLTGIRYDVWFTDHRGNRWYGVAYGDWGAAHCRRIGQGRSGRKSGGDGADRGEEKMMGRFNGKEFGFTPATLRAIRETVAPALGPAAVPVTKHYALANGYTNTLDVSPEFIEVNAEAIIASESDRVPAPSMSSSTPPREALV